MNFKARIRNLVLVPFNTFVYGKLYGMSLGKGLRLSTKASLDTTNPKGITIGDFTLIAAGCFVLSHDYTRSLKANTVIGSNVFIGVNSVVMPGVSIGNNSIIGAGSVVTNDVPANAIAVGIPAQVVKLGIQTGPYGRLIRNSESAQ